MEIETPSGKGAADENFPVASRLIAPALRPHVMRYLPQLHGESPETAPMSDALCAALQVLNHMQDLGPDRRRFDRVYLPEERQVSGEPIIKLALSWVGNHLGIRA